MRSRCALVALSLIAAAHAGTILMGQVQTGLPDVLRANERHSPNLLLAPARLSLREGGEDLPTPVFAPAGGGDYGADLAAQKLHLTLAYPSGYARCLELTVRDLADKPRSLSLTLTLALRPTASRAFFPAGNSPLVTLVPGAPAIGYGYAAGGIPLGLPLGQVYDPHGDWGVAWFGWLGPLVEPLGCRISRSTAATTVELTLPVTCPAGRSVVRRIGLAVTPGDWRPALAELLAAFPRSFAPNAAVAPLQGPFVCSGGTPTDAQIQDWYDQGCRVVEIHGTAPWYGEYVPQADKWTGFADDQWHFLKPRFEPPQRPADDAPWEVLRDWVEQQTPPTLTRAAVNDYIRRLHAHGMKGLIYFNPTEAWKPWALAKFPDDRSLDPRGEPYPAWYESAQMIPDKDRPWGRYLLEQLRGELDIYPEVDGVFFDQSAGGGHDLTELCAAGTQIVRAQGKLCWWNGPYNLELAQLADGMMTEGGGTDTYRHLTEMMQYYGMAGKPIVSLGPADTAGYAECLVHGVIPTPVSGSSAEMGERWFPLFRWLRNRRWVLEPRALDVPDGVRANLYRAPDGNLVMPFCREPLPDDKTARQFELAFTVRTADSGSIRAAYLLEPDLRGYHKLPLVRTGKALAVSVPRMGPAGLLVLAKAGVFAATEGGLAVVAGRPAKLRWTVDNWTGKPVRVALAGGAQTVAPGGSLARLAAGTPAGERWSVALSAKIAGRELAGPAEVWVDPPLLLFAEAPEEVRDDERLAVTARLLSHLPAGTKLKLTAGAEGLTFDRPEQPVTAEPERAVSVRLAGRPTTAGELSVRLTASASDGTTATADVPVTVLATALAPGGLAKVRAASLQLEVFGVDAGPYAHKPVTVNGALLGDLPQGSGDSWATRELPFPHEALRAVAERNEVRIDNGVGDNFKVRRLRLLLRLRGGVTVVSQVDTGAYTGGAGWAHEEGRAFASGQPLTGIVVNMPVDARRTERYEEFFGTPQSGRLVLDVFGSGAGEYVHKPVTINGALLGNLPEAPDSWLERSLALTPEALDALMTRNEVVIENSNPIDAFKVRRARIEMSSSEGKTYTSEVDEAAYTSCGWLFQEGKVGSPIRIKLAFKRPAP